MIQLTNIYKSYRSRKQKNIVLKNVDLLIEDAEMIAVLGRSGSGKTTLLNILGTLDKPDSGMCVVDGVRVDNLNEGKKAQYRNENIGIVMQDYSLLNQRTALFNVMLPMFFGKIKYKEMKTRAIKALEKVSISECALKKVNELSGGQRQRVAIARALVNNPKYLLADEPTGALDSFTSMEIMDLLRGINKEGTTVIVVTHEAMVAEKCSRIISIMDGEIIE